MRNNLINTSTFIYKAQGAVPKRADDKGTSSLTSQSKLEVSQHVRSTSWDGSNPFGNLKTINKVNKIGTQCRDARKGIFTHFPS